MEMFLKIAIKWLISAFAVLLAAYFLSGISISSFYIALVLALVLGLLNAVLRPILIVLTLPINILTLGLFTLIINGLVFWIPSTFIKGFYVENFWWAILGALLVSMFAWIGNKIVEDE